MFTNPNFSISVSECYVIRTVVWLYRLLSCDNYVKISRSVVCKTGYCSSNTHSRLAPVNGKCNPPPRPSGSYVHIWGVNNKSSCLFYNGVNVPGLLPPKRTRVRNIWCHSLAAPMCVKKKTAFITNLCTVHAMFDIMCTGQCTPIRVFWRYILPRSTTPIVYAERVITTHATPRSQTTSGMTMNLVESQIAITYERLTLSTSYLSCTISLCECVFWCLAQS